MEYTPQEVLVAMNHKKLTVAQIVRRTVFIIFGSILMGVGLEEFLFLTESLTEELSESRSFYPI